MGSEQRKAAQWNSVGLEGKLIMDQLAYQGWSQTASADNPVTDSAAGGTAISSGFHTNNGMIAMSPELKDLKTILEYAQERGMATGLLTNVQISHATPASFAAHVPHREQMTDIAVQLLDHQINVLFGGGEDEFLPTSSTGCYAEPGERSDGRNLIMQAQAAGYQTICTSAELAALDSHENNYVLGLFADEEMPRPVSPSLAEMTQTAIAILARDPQGFFLMVEGGQIDWASHANDAAHAIQDTLDFDAAVAIGVNYQQNNENTLLIVTADHETGGMNAHIDPLGSSDEDGPFSMPGGGSFYVTWTTSGHTGVNIPISTQGEGASALQGVFENTQTFWAMANLIFPHTYLPVLVR